MKPLSADGATFVSRLRWASKLFELPPAPVGKRGRPRKYGKHSISLIRRAAAPQGWQSLTYRCCGAEVTRQTKSSPATTMVTGGEICVVIVRFDDGNWAAYFGTGSSMTEREILQTAADRWAIRERFRTVKEIWRAGGQQIRTLWSSIGRWKLNNWLVTLIELESWELPSDELVDRSDRSSDGPDYSQSHADRRRRLMRKMPENQ